MPSLESIHRAYQEVRATPLRRPDDVDDLDFMVFGNTRYTGLDRTHDPVEARSLGMEAPTPVASPGAVRVALQQSGVDVPLQRY